MITTTYPRYQGDTAAPFIASIAEGVAALGHEVDVVLPFHPNLTAGERNGVRLHPYRLPGDTANPIWGYAQSMDADVKLKKKTYWMAPLALHRTYWNSLALSKERNFDLVHAHWVLPNGFPGALLARKSRIPLVVSLHGSDMFLARRSRVLGRVASWVFQRASAVTACSPDLEQQARELGSGNVRVLEYGVDIDHFAPSVETAIRPHSILAVGRLVYKKGFFPLLEAFTEVCKYYTDSTLTIAGDGPLRQKLQDHAGSLGIAASVQFTGNVGREQLPGLYASADLVAVPSITDESGNRDGLPNVFLEALSSGCAVLASDIPGMLNLVGPEREAVIVQSGNVPAWRDAILDLFRNPSECARLRGFARQKAIRDLSWKVRCRQFDALYGAVVET